MCLQGGSLAVKNYSQGYILSSVAGFSKQDLLLVSDILKFWIYFFFFVIYEG